MYIAIKRRCDVEDPFWSDCTILGLFSSKKEAEKACIEDKKRMMVEDETYSEIEADDNELFAIGDPEVGCPSKESWRVEEIDVSHPKLKDNV